MIVSAMRDLTPGFERDVVVRRPTFWTSEMFLRRDGKLVKIDKPDDAQSLRYREWLLLRLRSDWTTGGKTYRPVHCIATDLEKFLEGDRVFDMLFEPAERKSLVRFQATRHHILLTELDNVRSRIYVLTHGDGGWHREPLPGVPEFGEVNVDAVDADESDDYFLNVTDFLTPNTLAFGTVGQVRRQSSSSFPRSSTPVAWRYRSTRLSRRTARAFLTSRLPARTWLDGKNPTLLYGYGGFEIPMLPSYRPAVGRGLARERRGVRRGQHPRRRRVRAEVAPVGAQGQPAQGL